MVYGLEGNLSFGSDNDLVNTFLQVSLNNASLEVNVLTVVLCWRGTLKKPIHTYITFVYPRISQ